MQTIGLTALLKIEMPGGDVRWSPAGWFDFDGERYRERDPVWGAIGTVQSMGEGIGDEVPALQMTLLPPGTSEPSDFHPEGLQTSAVSWWTVEYDVSTGLLDEGSADLAFLGEIDQCSLEIDAEERRVAMSHVSVAERLFERAPGNSMNPVFHKALFPGELGHDEATGFGRSEAWGATNPGAASGAAVVRSSGGKRSFAEYERL